MQSISMGIELKDAIEKFYPTHSLEMVYFEAFSNALDAKADEIEIKINIDSFENPETLKITIKDNGMGFTDERFERFKHLLRKENKRHKGLGRLVFLVYFNTIKFESYYENKKRVIIFTSNEIKYEVEDAKDCKTGTTITFLEYSGEKINTYDFLKHDSVADKIRKHFLPTLYAMKTSKKAVKLNVYLNTTVENQKNHFVTGFSEFCAADLPVLKKISFIDNSVDLLEQLHLHYMVEKKYQGGSGPVAAICADGRILETLDILNKGSVPEQFEVIFLLFSKLFDENTSDSRSELKLDSSIKKNIELAFSEKIAEILNKTIPDIKEKNDKAKKVLSDSYPHLEGFFNKESIGLLDKEKILEAAQLKFFKKQREVLEAEELDDEKYEKSLEISSRVLAEYILYRNKIIDRLRSVQPDDNEDSIHNIIVPKKKILDKSNLLTDIYHNNVWILDDKYMSYKTILSDLEMDKVVKAIMKDEEPEKDPKRPDITMIFSGKPEDSPKVDVVVVELKKKRLDIKRKHDVVIQLWERARKLGNYYNDKIQRVWYYGILEFDNELRTYLTDDEFIPVFSNGDFYYKEKKVTLESGTKIIMGTNLISYDALLDDAKNRNATFLNILKEGFKEKKA